MPDIDILEAGEVDALAVVEVAVTGMLRYPISVLPVLVELKVCD
jgi:hypothetical protein